MRSRPLVQGLALTFCLFVAPPARATANIMVVRVGDGAAALSSASTAVFLVELQSDGTGLSTTTMPTAASGSNQPFTVAGTSASEGALARSADSLYVTLAGYAVAPGYASVGSSASATVNRVVARVDATGTMDTSTLLPGAFSGSSVRGAVSSDGECIWVVGNATNSSGGAQFVLWGSSVGTQVLATPNNCRVVDIAGGQLYATSGSSGYAAPFTVGTGMPTMAGQTATVLPGFTTTGASPYGFAIDPGHAVAYVADDRAVASGGGVQKWVCDGATWTLSATFTSGLSTGVRGLAVDWSGTTPRVYATTTQSSANQLVAFDDEGGTPTATVLATAPTNTVFRGVALAPAASTVDVGGQDGPLAAASVCARPNPCRSQASIECAVPTAGHVTLEVFDLQGRRVALLLDGEQPAGRFSVPLSAVTMGRGLCFVRLRTAGASVTTRLLRLE